MNILVGTASWTDKTLIECGRFYPKHCSTPEARLRHYAAHFPMVEIDSSYYAIPALSVSRNWVLRTPPEFIFNNNQEDQGQRNAKTLMSLLAEAD
jgi:uncharacterized protein YecE (DUF72 family)